MERINTVRSTIMMMITRISSAKVSRSLRKFSLSTDVRRLYSSPTFRRPRSNTPTSSPHAASTAPSSRAPLLTKGESRMATIILRSGLMPSQSREAVRREWLTGLIPNMSRCTASVPAASLTAWRRALKSSGCPTADDFRMRSRTSEIISVRSAGVNNGCGCMVSITANLAIVSEISPCGE